MVRALAGVADAFRLPLSMVNAHRVGRFDLDTFQDENVPTGWMQSGRPIITIPTA
jgi:hypothetical protein